MTRKNKPKPLSGSVPTYIQFTSDQFAAMYETVRKGDISAGVMPSKALQGLVDGFAVWFQELLRLEKENPADHKMTRCCTGTSNARKRDNIWSALRLKLFV